MNFNPTISFRGPTKFDVWTDRPMGITLGLSESSSSAAIGLNGGTSSSIENAGVTNAGSNPAYLYATPAHAWTNLTYDLADLLWPYQGSEQARHSLRNCLLELRKALGRSASIHLVTDFANCRLKDVVTDLDDFERLSRSRQRADLRAAAGL